MRHARQHLCDVAVVGQHDQRRYVALARLTQHQTLGHKDRPVYGEAFLSSVFRLGNHGKCPPAKRKGEMAAHLP
jgi:hypothetical protein